MKDDLQLSLDITDRIVNMLALLDVVLHIILFLDSGKTFPAENLRFISTTDLVDFFGAL